jgi:tRNA A37 methylthiotransferase MiaB
MWAEVPSIGFINSNGSFVQTPCSERISNLDEIPSPYLGGVFDLLMKTYPEERWSALWETNRGCPFTCAFCAWGSSAKKKVYTYSMERLVKEIAWFSKNKIEFIFCCDANFGLFEKRDLEIVEKVAKNKKRYGYPVAFSVQSTKNATKTIFELQKILNDAELQKGVNLALQSLNEETLKSIKRSNISIGQYQDLQKMFTDEGISTFSDIIIGLPDETYGSFTNGVSSLVEGGQHNRIQFINLSILENTEMAKPEYQKEHGLILQECRMASHHTRVDLDSINNIYETELLVVGTKTMPKEDWVKARVFAWMTSLLHFDKLIQIPFVILNKTCSLSYRELVEIFIIESDQYPLISEIKSLFTNKALSIQSGDSEYIPSPEWLNIWWPADEFAFIKLCREATISQFYEEAERVIIQYLAESGLSLPTKLLHEAVNLNAQLINKPFAYENQRICLGYNLIEVYKAALVGINLPLLEGNYYYEIIRDSQSFKTWDSWCREIVWYGTKKGAYLYDFVAR